MTYPNLELIPSPSHSKDIPSMYKLRWIYPDGSIRIPREIYQKQNRHEPFTAGGKHYDSLEELCVLKKAGETSLFRDVHGREVLAVVRPFPQLPRNFYPEEDRCHRWFYIRLRDSVSVVFQSDGDVSLLIAEDFALALEHCQGKLEKLRCPEESTEEGWQEYTGLPGKTEETP